MKILLTGDRGYFGSVLVQRLLSEGYNVTGYDVDYYDGCDIYPVDRNYPQITKDIRDVELSDLKGIDVVCHLAALSNDPLGELTPGLTEEINFKSTMKLAKLAQDAGVKRFIYSSSQSMYGVSNTDSELDEDKSEKNPVTAYAVTKWEAELALKKLSTKDFAVVCFRPSTIFGMSPRLRCDIVYNNLVACAFTTGKIEIKSDGTPWRPVVHVQDVSSAFIAGIKAPLELIEGQSFNVGIPNGNFTVRNLAEAAHQVIPGSEISFTNEHGKDARSYRVSFSKILTVLKDYYKPEWSLEKGGIELREKFKEINFSEAMFRGRISNRLAQINYLIEQKLISNSLRKENNNMEKIYNEITNCRIFKESKLEVFFDLGDQPPANSLRTSLDEKIPTAPLTLAWSEKAKTVQLTVDVKREFLFRNYVWVTGTSKTAIEHSHFFAEQLLKRSPKPSPFVVEVASNDGTFLKPLIEKGLKVLGVDPAINIAEEAARNGIPTNPDFFGVDAANKVIKEHGKADVLFARNVIPHVENIHDVMNGFASLLEDEGLGVIEFHHAGKILKELHYDSIYHEHMFYYSLEGMTKMLNHFGFHPFDLEYSPISGGSFIVYFSKKQKLVSDKLKAAAALEVESRINEKSEWDLFAKRCVEHKSQLLHLMENELKEGRKVVGYGASARSSTLLNYCEINGKYLTAIADKSPHKHNKYTAGTNVLILSPNKALALKPDTILLLAWNFEDEILAELKEVYKFKGRVIIPLPNKPRVIEL
ncbi:MAG: NAD-dependent epimerase/dehydratase family protein [Bacteriovorax sp.]|nr:NAD-dependent epimerase/dehydratase family protein [Bacteriovorax sp.]